MPKKSVVDNLKEDAKNLKDRADAKAKETTGAVKEALGKATGNTKLQAEGAVEKVAGKVGQGTAKVKEGAKKAKDAVEGAVKQVKKELKK